MSLYETKLLQGKLKELSGVKVESLHCKMNQKCREFGYHLMMPLAWQWRGHLGISVWRNMEWSQYLSFHTGHLQTRISSLSLPRMVYVFSAEISPLAIPFPSVNIESDFLLFYDSQLMDHCNLILIFLRPYVCWLKIYGLWLNMSMPLTLSHILYTAKQRGKLVEEFCVYSYTNQAIALFERQIRTKAHYGWWSILQCGLWIAMIVFWIVGFFKSK